MPRFWRQTGEIPPLDAALARDVLERLELRREDPGLDFLDRSVSLLGANHRDVLMHAADTYAALGHTDRAVEVVARYLDAHPADAPAWRHPRRTERRRRPASSRSHRRRRPPPPRPDPGAHRATRPRRSGPGPGDRPAT